MFFLVQVDLVISLSVILYTVTARWRNNTFPYESMSLSLLFERVETCISVREKESRSRRTLMQTREGQGGLLYWFHIQSLMSLLPLRVFLIHNFITTLNLSGGHSSELLLLVYTGEKPYLEIPDWWPVKCQYTTHFLTFLFSKCSREDIFLASLSISIPTYISQKCINSKKKTKKKNSHYTF